MHSEKKMILSLQQREQVETAIRDAAEKMLEAANGKVFTKEGHSNFVTQGDLAVQNSLMDSLSKLVPEAVFFSEEKENEELTDQPTWIIDPIDGTLNYIHRRNCSMISVGLCVGKVPVYGFAYNPYTDEMFTAALGGGAFLNGTPIHVSETPFEKSVVGIGTSPYNLELAEMSIQACYRFLTEGGDLRRTGSAVQDFCDVACGRSEIFFEYSSSPWDFTASALIVTEAGGVFTKPLEGEVSFGKPGCVLASNKPCLEKAQEIIRSCVGWK